MPVIIATLITALLLFAAWWLRDDVIDCPHCDGDLVPAPSGQLRCTCCGHMEKA